MFKVRLTRDAEADLDRLFDFLLERELARNGGDLSLPEQAMVALRAGIATLKSSPFTCRKAGRSPFLRELIIAFGRLDDVALFDIEDTSTAAVVAVRHQFEDNQPLSEPFMPLTRERTTAAFLPGGSHSTHCCRPAFEVDRHLADLGLNFGDLGGLRLMRSRSYRCRHGDNRTTSLRVSSSSKTVDATPMAIPQSAQAMPVVPNSCEAGVQCTARACSAGVPTKDNHSMRLSRKRALNTEPLSLRALNTLKNWNSMKEMKMEPSKSNSRLDRVAEELLAALDGARCVPLPSKAPGSLSVDEARDVGERLHALRVARGERPLGWKIGFTNRSIWARYGVHAPIWGPVWDTTAQLLDTSETTLSLAGLSQPRLEPEIVFGFAATPSAGMDLDALLGCIGWVAHGFEVVHTHFAGWTFSAADCLADFALHGRLRVGPRRQVSDWPGLGADLAALRIALFRDGEQVDAGVGTNVLDGPLNALRLWIDAMAAQTPRWRVQAGEFVTTGTLTDAWPLAPGQRWHTELQLKGPPPTLPSLVLHTMA